MVRVHVPVRVARLLLSRATCAALRLLPDDVAVSLFPCWSCEAWSHAEGVFDWAWKRPVRGLGRRPNKRPGISKRYSGSLLAIILRPMFFLIANSCFFQMDNKRKNRS